jgi:predicted O-methyltransferase YrrM
VLTVSIAGLAGGLFAVAAALAGGLLGWHPVTVGFGAASLAAVACAFVGLLVLWLWVERDQLALLREQRVRSQNVAGAVAPGGTLDTRLARVADGLGEQEAAWTRLEDQLGRLEDQLESGSSVELWRRVSTELLAELLTVRDLAEEAATHRSVENLYAQFEALLHLERLLGSETPPLPPLRGWALSPDVALHALRVVLERRPGTVVELGSGASSVVLGHAVRLAGRGRVISLEHDEGFLERTRALLEEHGLADTVELIHAPLVDHQLEGERWRWYDTSWLNGFEGPLEFLLVDGPPTTTGHLARYPTLPLLAPLLASDAVILLDDGARPAEREVLERWRAELPGAKVLELPHEKGTVELRLGAFT